MSDGNSTQARVSGNTDPSSGVGSRRAVGARITGVLTLAAVSVTLSFVRDVDLRCISISPGLCPNYVVTQIAVGETNFISTNQATFASSVGSALQNGVPATAFAPYALCSDMINGFCLKASVGITVQATNITNATSAFDVTITAVVRPGEAC